MQPQFSGLELPNSSCYMSHSLCSLTGLYGGLPQGLLRGIPGVQTIAHIGCRTPNFFSPKLQSSWAKESFADVEVLEERRFMGCLCGAK